MIKPYLYNLNIDHEFKHLTPDMMQEEYEKLEGAIVASGCREPIIVWNDYIIDGHTRYNICHKWSIPFAVSSIHFSSREDTISWICRRQLEKKHITGIMRRYLLGKCFIAEKGITGRNYEGTDMQGKSLNPHYITAIDLGSKYDISHHTIYKYGMMANAFDLIFQKEPALPHRILSGQIKISYENIVILSKLSKDKLRSLNRYLADSQQDHILLSDIEHEIQCKASTPQYSEIPVTPEPSFPIKAAIKEMPQYDPDAETSSLALTIPSWISTMERTQSKANLQLITTKARIQIKQQLFNLCHTTEILLNAIKEYE
ncbi:hypothetical protein LAD12857_19710 [Lacrimispora amygdalina]|uniref:ParB/Sulfiredoxin domain-containing protein n=1 Tax=Lacrimispora amygdalina TaxID=253257 RepID=A0ABQ5M536_9FIRM